jgi:hypothetical protein
MNIVAADQRNVRKIDGSRAAVTGRSTVNLTEFS